MLKLAALSQWNTDSFSATLKQELQSLAPDSLPLDKATNQGGMVDDSQLSVTVLKTMEHDNYIEVIVGVFFNEIIGGCNCHDDPVSENSYCELRLDIDKQTAQTRINIISD